MKDRVRSESIYEKFQSRHREMDDIPKSRVEEDYLEDRIKRWEESWQSTSQENARNNRSSA